MLRVPKLSIKKTSDKSDKMIARIGKNLVHCQVELFKNLASLQTRIYLDYLQIVKKLFIDFNLLTIARLRQFLLNYRYGNDDE